MGAEDSSVKHTLATKPDWEKWVLAARKEARRLGLHQNLSNVIDHDPPLAAGLPAEAAAAGRSAWQKWRNFRQALGDCTSGAARGFLGTNAAALLPMNAGQFTNFYRANGWNVPSAVEQSIENSKLKNISFDGVSSPADIATFLDHVRSKLLSLPQVYARQPNVPDGESVNSHLLLGCRKWFSSGSRLV